MTIDSFINATRRNIPSRVIPELYEHFDPLVSLVLGGRSDINLKVCFSPERRTEHVLSGGVRYLIYDQYLGQTFSNISRIIYEAESAAYGFNYSCKILAEYFAMKGAFKEAALFARIHTVDDNKLSKIKKTQAPTEQRLSAVYFQERFLCAHELVHHLDHQGADVFKHAQEIVELYFEGNEAQKKTVLEIAKKEGIDFTDKELEERYPNLKDVDASLIDEITCDMIALDLVTTTSEIDGSDSYPVAALGCFQALKSLQMVSILRLAVEHYCDGDNRAQTLPSLMSDYQLRAAVLNWLCNNPEYWCSKERSPIVAEIGNFLDQFHDKFATIAISLADLVINRGFEKEFHRDCEYLENVFSEKSMQGGDILKVVDAMCGMPELTATRMFNDL